MNDTARYEKNQNTVDAGTSSPQQYGGADALTAILDLDHRRQVLARAHERRQRARRERIREQIACASAEILESAAQQAFEVKFGGHLGLDLPVLRWKGEPVQAGRWAPHAIAPLGRGLFLAHRRRLRPGQSAWSNEFELISADRRQPPVLVRSLPELAERITAVLGETAAASATRCAAGDARPRASDEHPGVATRPHNATAAADDARVLKCESGDRRA